MHDPDTTIESKTESTKTKVSLPVYGISFRSVSENVKGGYAIFLHFEQDKKERNRAERQKKFG